MERGASLHAQRPRVDAQQATCRRWPCTLPPPRRDGEQADGRCPPRQCRGTVLAATTSAAGCGAGGRLVDAVDACAVDGQQRAASTAASPRAVAAWPSRWSGRELGDLLGGPAWRRPAARHVVGARGDRRHATGPGPAGAEHAAAEEGGRRDAEGPGHPSAVSAPRSALLAHHALAADCAQPRRGSSGHRRQRGVRSPTMPSATSRSSIRSTRPPSSPGAVQMVGRSGLIEPAQDQGLRRARPKRCRSRPASRLERRSCSCTVMLAREELAGKRRCPVQV